VTNPNPTAAEPVRMVQLDCDHCDRQATIWMGDRSLCGRCALGSTHIGIESLAELIERYAQVVGAYLNGEKAPAIRHAYEIGLEAHARGAGTLDLAVLHQVALGLALVNRDVPDDVVRLVHMAAVPLAQVLGPFEEAVLDRLREHGSRPPDDHDDTIQVMSGVASGLEVIRRRIDDPELAPIISYLSESVRLSIERLGQPTSS
jgi:hypothetical protein